MKKSREKGCDTTGNSAGVVIELCSAAAAVAVAVVVVDLLASSPLPHITKNTQIAQNTSDQVRNRSETSLINRPFHPKCPIIWVIGFVKFEIRNLAPLNGLRGQRCQVASRNNYFPGLDLLGQT